MGFLLEEGKVSPPEVPGFDPAYRPASSTQDPELDHFMVTAAKKTLGGSKVEVGIPELLFSYKTTTVSTAATQFLVSLEQHHYLQPCAVLLTCISPLTAPSMAQRPPLLHRDCSNFTSPLLIHSWNLLRCHYKVECCLSSLRP